MPDELEATWSSCPVCGTQAVLVGGLHFHVDGSRNTECWNKLKDARKIALKMGWISRDAK